MTVKRQQ